MPAMKIDSSAPIDPAMLSHTALPTATKAAVMSEAEEDVRGAVSAAAS